MWLKHAETSESTTQLMSISLSNHIAFSCKTCARLVSSPTPTSTNPSERHFRYVNPKWSKETLKWIVLLYQIHDLRSPKGICRPMSLQPGQVFTFWDPQSQWLVLAPTTWAFLANQNREKTTPLLLNSVNCSDSSNWSANSAGRIDCLDHYVTFLNSNPQRLEASQLDIDETQNGCYIAKCVQPRQTTGTTKPRSTRTEATANCRLETWPKKAGLWLLSYQVVWAVPLWLSRKPQVKHETNCQKLPEKLSSAK